MTQQQALEIVSLECDGDKVNLSDSLDSLGLDSLDFIGLVNTLERLADRDLPNKKLITLRTVGDLTEFFSETLSQWN